MSQPKFHLQEFFTGHITARKADMIKRLGVGIIENLSALEKAKQGIKLMNVDMGRETKALQNLHFSYFHAKNVSLPI